MSWAADWADARTPADRERQQLEAIARWDGRTPWVQQRRLNAALRRAGLPVPETRADQRLAQHVARELPSAAPLSVAFGRNAAAES